VSLTRDAPSNWRFLLFEKLKYSRQIFNGR
jgi:hypothetical protein